MHQRAFDFVKQFSTPDPISVIEIGSRNLNGTVRPLFPAAKWIGLDLYPGPDVDVVCDMLDYTPDSKVDLVVCCEVLEHADRWADMLRHASTWLVKNGRLLVTCAGPGRRPHSHVDGKKVRPGEYYGNIHPDELRRVLGWCGLDVLICTQLHDDTQSAAIYHGCPPTFDS